MLAKWGWVVGEIQETRLLSRKWGANFWKLTNLTKFSQISQSPKTAFPLTALAGVARGPQHPPPRSRTPQRTGGDGASGARTLFASPGAVPGSMLVGPPRRRTTMAAAWPVKAGRELRPMSLCDPARTARATGNPDTTRWQPLGGAGASVASRGHIQALVSFYPPPVRGKGPREEAGPPRQGGDGGAAAAGGAGITKDSNSARGARPNGPDGLGPAGGALAKHIDVADARGHLRRVDRGLGRRRRVFWAAERLFRARGGVHARGRGRGRGL